jgi:SAM-dependent methyltransferase
VIRQDELVHRKIPPSSIGSESPSTMPSALPDEIYVSPPNPLPALDECSFYHTLDLPGLGVQLGSWDLRQSYDAYLAGHVFTGQRVLDIGTASGALAFEMERRGAREVVAFDLDQDASYDCRLPADPAALATFREWVQKVKNGFWVARAALGSNVKVAYGHAARLPAALGWFDTIVMGNILQHLQDPVAAILHAIRYTDHLIITEADWLSGTSDDLPALIMYDLPHFYSWYQVKPRLIQMLLQQWGFTDQMLTHHTQILQQRPEFAENKMDWKTTAVPTRHFTLSLRRPRA